MTQVALGYQARVPGNASRFFRTREEALEQPDGEVHLVSDSEDPFIRNASFDASLIRHDQSYCTSVVDLDQVVQLPTSSYFIDRVAPHLHGRRQVVDIGCGQGEFVELLRRSGVAAVGYDPVLRCESPHLHRRYWSPDELPAELYVMRCVLPHIPDPWEFLDAGRRQPTLPRPRRVPTCGVDSREPRVVSGVPRPREHLPSPGPRRSLRGGGPGDVLRRGVGVGPHPARPTSWLRASTWGRLGPSARHAPAHGRSIPLTDALNRSGRPDVSGPPPRESSWPTACEA